MYKYYPHVGLNGPPESATKNNPLQEGKKHNNNFPKEISNMISNIGNQPTAEAKL